MAKKQRNSPPAVEVETVAVSAAPAVELPLMEAEATPPVFSGELTTTIPQLVTAGEGVFKLACASRVAPVINCGIFKVKEDAFLPEYATEGSMCFDLKACITDAPVSGYNKTNEKIAKRSGLYDNSNKVMGVPLEPGDRLMIPTGLIFDIPVGCAIILYPRSGLALKSGVRLTNCNGVIDSDYVEETFVLLENTSTVRILVMHGDKVCQGELIQTPPKASFKEQTGRPAQKTSRNGGMGSTGK